MGQPERIVHRGCSADVVPTHSNLAQFLLLSTPAIHHGWPSQDSAVVVRLHHSHQDRQQTLRFPLTQSQGKNRQTHWGWAGQNSAGVRQLVSRLHHQWKGSQEDLARFIRLMLDLRFRKDYFLGALDCACSSHVSSFNASVLILSRWSCETHRRKWFLSLGRYSWLKSKIMIF